MEKVKLTAASPGCLTHLSTNRRESFTRLLKVVAHNGIGGLVPTCMTTIERDGVKKVPGRLAAVIIG
jgi:hypothetical protein